jgi:hypothetical protein
VGWSLTTNDDQIIFKIVSIDKACGAAACTAASATWNSRCVMKIGSLSAPGQYLIFSAEVALRAVSYFIKIEAKLCYSAKAVKFEWLKAESGK